MAFELGMTVDLCMTYNDAHDRFHDLDLGGSSQWVGRGTQSALNCLDNEASHRR